MNVKEAKNQIIELIIDDLGKDNYLNFISPRLPKSLDEGKFLILGKPARAIHRFNGWNIPINLTWFSGGNEQPSIKGEEFYWYAFAIPDHAGFKEKHYFICDYDQVRKWVLDFKAPLGVDHKNQRYWRADIQFYGRSKDGLFGYFRWGDEPTDELTSNNRVILLDNIKLIRKDPEYKIPYHRIEMHIRDTRRNAMNQIEVDDLLLEIDESQEDQAYVTYDIATYPSDYTLSGIVDMWLQRDITIPEFQREFVWNIKQSSSLIESFLLGLPVPPVFFYIDDENKNLVIDGQQRILSVVFYFDGYFGFENLQGKRQVFRLEGLDERSPFYRSSFSELSPSDQRKLRGTVLRAMNVRQLSPAGENTSIYHIFERLNTSGTPLKSQEIRNVVFRGEIVQVLRNLNLDENWRLIIGQPNLNKHQVDVELVLRVFAFIDGASKYEKPMKEFLNKAMKKNRYGNTPEIQRFQNVFPILTKRIVDILGPKPFHIRGRLNTSALDAVMSILIQNYDAIPDDLALRYKKLIETSRFQTLTTIGTTDTATVRERFRLVKKILLGN